MMAAIRVVSITSQSHHPPSPPKPPFPAIPKQELSTSISTSSTTRRAFVSVCSLSSLISLIQPPNLIAQTPSSSSTNKTILSGITSTKSWFRFFGDGFSIRVPPDFQDIMEPEDYNAGLSLYGDKAKPKTFAARFATPDGSEVLSVVLRPSNQLKITFLEAKDVSDFGTLKEAKKIFVPGGTDLYSARVIKIKEDDGYRTYYFYEFGNDDQRAALVAAVNSGKELQGLLLPLSTTVASLFGQQSQFSAYNDRSISILGRTGCTFNWSDSGSCATGDCGSGQMECGGTTVPTPPVTVSYFNTYIEMENLIYSTYYNVSIINGYNLPMTIEPTGGIGFCLKTGCADDLNRRCPLELKLKDGKGCKSACQVNPSQ